jgi:hypothetical protein
MTAKVQLTDVTVNWVSDSGKVFEVTETVTTNTGASWPRKWGVVLEGANVAVNDVVSVVGEYSDKLEEYQGKHFTKRTLWNPIVTRSGATVDAPVTSGDAPF